MRKYEKPMLLDLEEVSAMEATVCDTGGSAAAELPAEEESFSAM